MIGRMHEATSLHYPHSALHVCNVIILGAHMADDDLLPSPRPTQRLMRLMNVFLRSRTLSGDALAALVLLATVALVTLAR
jgi:hypothetical protein